MLGPSQLCNSMDCSPPGSSISGIFQARIREQAATSYFRGSSRRRDRTCISCGPCIGRWTLHHCHLGSPHPKLDLSHMAKKHNFDLAAKPEPCTCILLTRLEVTKEDTVKWEEVSSSLMKLGRSL